jgi:hypothetical protein
MKTCRKVHNLRRTYFYLNVSKQHCINKWTQIAMNWLTFSVPIFDNIKFTIKTQNNHFGIQMFDIPQFLSNISKTNKTNQENPSNQNKLFLTTKQQKKSVYQNGMQIKLNRSKNTTNILSLIITQFRCRVLCQTSTIKTSVQVEKFMEIIIHRW